MIEHKSDSFEIDDESLALISSKLNGEQLSAVKETSNVVVSAGAGSGKTTVLASRYAYLIEAKNVPCEKILTLTFTKKAANEMKERIFTGLKNHLNGYPIRRKADTAQLPADFPNLESIKKRAKAAIENFDKAHIQTLDSYFSEIAKKGARYYGITPNFSLDDEKINSAIRFKATKYVMENLNESEIKEIAQVFQIQNLASNLFADSVLKFSTILTPIDFDSSLKKQKEKLLADYKILAAKISDELGAFLLLPRKDKPSPTLQKLYSYIEAVGNPSAPELTDENIENSEADSLFVYIKSLSGYCSSSLSYVRDDSYKTFKANLLSYLESLYLIANSISGFKLQKKIFAHLSRFQEEVNRTKRTGGFLSFADVSQLALAVLCEHPEIRHVEQQKFDAIMIDEFQDDNQLQCDVLMILSDANEKFDSEGNYLLPKLSDPELSSRLDTHKLFFVGDDKQSIYRFRGADVSVFRKLSDSIEKSIELKTNYRSAPELIRAFNTIFGGYDYPDGEKVNTSLPAIFMTANRVNVPDYEAVYKKVEVPADKKSDFSEKKITVALYPKKVDEQKESEDDFDEERIATECEASFVAREIKKLVEEKNDKGEQKYHYSDIALLFRTSTPTGTYENVLLQNGIPYSTEVYKGFFSDGPVNDIISLLKLCVFPDDKNAYAKVLRSPFCSLTFAELEKILVNTKQPYKTPFDSQMLSALAEDSELLTKIQNLKAIYDDINARLKTEKLTKTISYIWYELGYRYETLWNKSVAMYASFYDILFEMARLAEDKTQSLAVFLDFVKSYENDRKLDGLDVVLDAEDAVQILTVHKSKGLEYKVVFVCAASGTGGGAFSTPIDCDKEFGLLLKTPAWELYESAAGELPSTCAAKKNLSKNYFFALVGQKNEKEECAELRRQAYVALTRAEERLYIVGSDNAEFADEKKSRKFEFDYEDAECPKSFYQLLLPILFNKCTNNPAFNFVNDRESFAAISNDGQSKAEKSDFIKNLEPQECTVINEELSPKVYVSPSKLKVSNEKLGVRSEDFRPGELPFDFEEPPANPEYELINKIVESTVPTHVENLNLEDDGEEGEGILPAFSFTNFGTIAHAYMEAKVLGCEPKINEREWLGMNEQTIPAVGIEKWNGITKREKKISKIRELCEDMAKKYELSSIYKESVSSDWKKTEYTFRSFIEDANFSDSEGTVYAKDLIVSGQIDLVYKNPDSSSYKYTIVDYKTNQKIEPGLYYSQLSCYKRAVSQMLGIQENEIRCVLYYLRFAKEIDITEKL